MNKKLLCGGIGLYGAMIYRYLNPVIEIFTSDERGYNTPHPRRKVFDHKTSRILYYHGDKIISIASVDYLLFTKINIVYDSPELCYDTTHYRLLRTKVAVNKLV